RVEATMRNHVLATFGGLPIAGVRPSEVQAWTRGLSSKLSPATIRTGYSVLRSLMRAAVLDRVIASSRCVRVERQLNEQGQLGQLKTARSQRTVSLPSVVADRLAAHLSASGRRSGLILVDSSGVPVKRNTFTKTWRAAVRRAGLGDSLKLHSMRHAYASALIVAGESVEVVQARMGHASAMVTLDVCGHLWPDSGDKTRAAIEAFLAPPADSVRTPAGLAQVSGPARDYLEKS
ncbi:MAG: tyrosine-type recombinase/integrase, partial [Actinomycetota bacterium]|nr:tyrosine-type recombinase/integrase [Actinomycetota bacterium]